MEKKIAIKIHDESAHDYDQQVVKYNWFGHEILFGMCVDYIRPGDFLLDVGIGTGLGSKLFSKFGLKVFGIDGSQEMLRICQSKCMTEDLQVFDLHNSPLPYSDHFFNHAVSCGVFHFFNELDSIFKEISRVIRPHGIFAFTTMSGIQAEKKDIPACKHENCSVLSVEQSAVFIHSNHYIKNIIIESGFKMLKKVKFIVWNADENRENFFHAYVVQSQGML